MRVPEDPFKLGDAPAAASLILSPEESVVYTSIFKVLDTEKTGYIGMTTAAAFLNRSKLPHSVLREIWDLSDVNRKGALDEESMFRALKYIAVVQAGKPLISSSLSSSTSLPVFEGFAFEATKPAASSTNPSSLRRVSSIIERQALVSAEDKERFKTAFLQCQTVNGYADGTKSRTLFLKSGLTPEILAQVWTLVDTQANGKLNMQQFCVAMYLIAKIKNGQLKGPPSSVPESLFKSFEDSTTTQIDEAKQSVHVRQSSQMRHSVNRSNSVVMDAAFAPSDVKPRLIKHAASSLLDASNEDLLVGISALEREQASQYFEALDSGEKGYLTGQESFAFFLKSSLPQSTLEEIWNMADQSKTGKLTREQFIYAVHLVKMKKVSSTGSLLDSAPATPIVTQKNLMDDLLVLDAPSPIATSFAKPQPLASLASRESGSSSELLSLSAAGTSEAELAKKQGELADLDNKMKMLQPASEELKKRRETVDAQLRACLDQKNQATLKYSQMRAMFEASSQIVRDLDEALARDKQYFEATNAELSRLETGLNQMNSEKTRLTMEIDRLKNETADMQAQFSGYRDSSVKLEKQLESLKQELEEQLLLFESQQKMLQQAQADYQLKRRDVQQTQQSLAQTKEKNDKLARQIAVQSVMKPTEKSTEKSTEKLADSFSVKSQENLRDKSLVDLFLADDTLTQNQVPLEPFLDQKMFGDAGSVRSLKADDPFAVKTKASASPSTPAVSASPAATISPSIQATSASPTIKHSTASPTSNTVLNSVSSRSGSPLKQVEISLNSSNASNQFDVYAGNVTDKAMSSPAKSMTSLQMLSDTPKASSLKDFDIEMNSLFGTTSNDTAKAVNVPSSTKTSNNVSFNSAAATGTTTSSTISPTTSPATSPATGTTISPATSPATSATNNMIKSSAQDNPFNLNAQNSPSSKLLVNDASPDIPASAASSSKTKNTASSNPFSGNFNPIVKDDPFAIPLPPASTPQKADINAAFGEMTFSVREKSPSEGLSVDILSSNIIKPTISVPEPNNNISLLSQSNNSLDTNETRKTTGENAKKVRIIVDPNVQQLVSMGFSQEKSIKALAKAKNDLTKAAELLLGE